MTDSDSTGGNNRTIMKSCKTFFERTQKAFNKRKLFFRTQFEKIRMVYSPGWEYCDSCYTVEGTQEDFVMKCQVCDLRVHQSCYGTRWVDDDDYFICYRCAYLIDSKKPCDSIKCSLCPEIKGALRPLFPDYTKPWAHKTCLNYKLNCWWEDETLGFLAVQKDTEFQYDSNENCDVCGSKMGTVIKCDYSSGCQFKAHSTCLAKIGVIREYNDMTYQTEKEGYNDESHVIALLCLNHLKKTDKNQFLRAQEFASKMILGQVSLFDEPNSPEITKFMNEKLYIQKFRQLQPALQQEIQQSKSIRDEILQSESSRNRTSRSREIEKYSKAKKTGKLESKPLELVQTQSLDQSVKGNNFKKPQNIDPLMREKSKSPLRIIERSPIKKLPKTDQIIRSTADQTNQTKTTVTLSTQKSVSPFVQRDTTPLVQRVSPLVQRDITSYFGKQPIPIQTQAQIQYQTSTGTPQARGGQKVTQKIQIPEVNENDLKLFDIVRFYTMTLGKPTLEEIQDKITSFDTIQQAANFLYIGLNFRADSQSNLKEIIKNVQDIQNHVDTGQTHLDIRQSIQEVKVPFIQQKPQTQQIGITKSLSIPPNQVKPPIVQPTTTSNPQPNITQSQQTNQQQTQSSNPYSNQQSDQQDKISSHKQSDQQDKISSHKQNKKDEKKQGNEKQKPDKEGEEKEDHIFANEPQIRKKVKGAEKDAFKKEDKKLVQQHKKNKEALQLHKFKKAFANIREQIENDEEENEEKDGHDANIDNRLEMTLEIQNQESSGPIKNSVILNNEDYTKFQENNKKLHATASIYLLKRAKEFYLNLKKQQSGKLVN